MTQQSTLGRAMGVTQGLQGLRAQQQAFDVNQMNMQNTQADRMTAQQQAEAQAAQQAQLMELRQRAAQGDAQAMRQLVATDPEVGGKLREQLGLIDEGRVTQSLNQAAGLKRMLEQNPEQAVQYWQQNLADDPAFAGLADNFQAGDIEGALNEIGMGVTLAGGEEAYQNLFGPGEQPNIGTYNPRDYTTESFSEFTRSGDPSVLERYYPMKQTNIGGTTYFSDDQGNLYLPASPEVQQGAQPPAAGDQPAGPVTQPEPMTPEAQALREADRTRRIEQARREAAAEAEAQSPEAQEQRRIKQQEVDRTRDLVDRLLESDNLGKISGWETDTPLVGSTYGRAQAAFARDELNDLKSLANLLTMGNLGRMSGVLSESDIRLIATAASGMEIGESGTPISEDRLREILVEIRDRLPDGSNTDEGIQPAPSGPVNWSDL